MSKSIAIVARPDQAALAAALQHRIAADYPGHTFTVVEKISDVPAGSAIGSFGMPTYVPGSSGVRVIAVGTRPQKDADARKAQFEVIRNAASTVEDILPELGLPDEYLVLSKRAVTGVRIGLADHRVAIAEAIDDAGKLEAYKAAYEYLLGAFPGVTK